MSKMVKKYSVLISIGLLIILLFLINHRSPIITIATITQQDTSTIHHYVLSNGLTLLIHHKPQAPHTFLQITYNVGSAKESHAPKGIAHIIEHMLFKGTTTYAERDIPAIARMFGAKINAATSFDFTWYYVDTSNDHWKPFIDIFADCMCNARFAKQHLASEIKTIIREVKTAKNTIHKILREQMFEYAYPPNHPYHFSIGGYYEDLNRITPQDLHTFYKKHYRPDNAVLFITGGCDPESVKTYVQKVFGPIKQPQEPKPSSFNSTSWSNQLGKNVTLYKKVAHPRIAFFWTIPGLKDEDEIVSSDLAFLIGNTMHGSLYHEVITNQKQAISLSVAATKHLYGGLFIITCTPTKNEYTALAQTITTHLQTCAKQGFSSDAIKTMTAHKQRIFYQDYLQPETMTRNWSKSFLATHNPFIFFQRPHHYNLSDPKKLQSFIATYLQPEFMHQLTILPLNKKRKRSLEKITEKKEQRDAQLLQSNPRSTPLDTLKRALTLTPPPLIIPSYPQPNTTVTYPHGLTVIMAQRHDTPLVTLQFGLKNACFFETSYQSVFLETFMKIVCEQIKHHPNLPRSLTITHNTTSITCSCLASDADATIDLIASLFSLETLTNAEPEYKSSRRAIYNLYKKRKNRHKETLYRTITQHLYPQTCFDWSFNDALATLKTITATELFNSLTPLIHAQNLICVIVGDIDCTKLESHLQKTFGTFATNTPLPVPNTPLTPSHHKPHIEIKTQSPMITTELAAPHTISLFSYEYATCNILEHVCFHGWGSRLFSLRESYGLFYSNFGAFAQNAEIGHGFHYWGAITTHDAFAQTTQKLTESITKLFTTGITTQECAAAKQLIIKQWNNAFASPQTQVRILFNLYAHNHSIQDLNEYLRTIETCSYNDVSISTHRLINPHNFFQATIGNQNN
ncbi:MAG: Peptidase M16 domain protein [candidate division TM6 bacterium GW2011_GWF2_38_10]|nr:MAG: Peptidase M16 domain protein [candidate division TM6 bacterium GW2011_GWF2_38_10]